MSVSGPGRGLPTACCLGDSISDPVFRTTSAWPTWLPDFLQGWNVQAHGVSGNDTATLLTRLGVDGQIHTYEETPFFAPPKPGKGRCYVLIGVNDIIYSIAGSATIITNLTAIYAYLNANGWEPYPMTILPFGNHTAWTSAMETIRAAVNTFIMGTAWKTINLEPSMADVTIPSQPKLRSVYDGGDGLHPGILGAKQLAVIASLR